MNDCRTIELELGAYAGCELDNGTRVMVRAHLESCASCREELAREKHLHRTLRTIPTVSAPPELESRIQLAIQAGRPARKPVWKTHRLTAAVMLAAASLAVALLVPGLLTSPAPEWSEQEIAAGRQDVMYTLVLTAKILDHTRKDTLVDVFADKLPQAINDSFKMTKSNNSGGNG
jgi:anti-sigma factor RsiW